jgi:hypothetical protein
MILKKNTQNNLIKVFWGKYFVLALEKEKNSIEKNKKF